MADYEKVYNDIEKKIGNIKKLRDEGTLWLNSKKIADLIGTCRFWVWKRIRANDIKSKINKVRGRKKIYRMVHIDWLIEFLEDMIKKKPDLVKNHKTGFKKNDKMVII